MILISIWQALTEVHAKGARGHVDCREILKDNSLASAVPIVTVTHPLAKVTHEAAIWKHRSKRTGNPDGGSKKTLGFQTPNQVCFDIHPSVARASRIHKLTRSKGGTGHGVHNGRS
jgi:hypothetical protein